MMFLVYEFNKSQHEVKDGFGMSKYIFFLENEQHLRRMIQTPILESIFLVVH